MKIRSQPKQQKCDLYAIKGEWTRFQL